MNSLNQISKWFEAALWLLLVGLATVYCWERSLYQDSAFALFRVLNLQNTMEHGRFLVPISILPAYLFSNFGLPINFVVWAFSMSGVFYAGLLSYYFHKKSNSPIWKWLPPLVILLCGPEFFFLGISEMISAILLSLLFAHSFWESKKWALIPLILSFFAHPGIMPALIFIVALSLLKNYKNYLGYLYSIIIIGLVYFKTKYQENSAYESGILENINSGKLSTLFNSWGWNFFTHSLFSWMFPVLAFTVVTFILVKFSVRSVLSFSIFFALTLFIVFVFQSGDSLLMMQKSYAPITAMGMLYFVFFQPDFKKNIPWKTLFTVLAFFGGYLIANEGQFYRNRMKKIDQLISQVKPGKYFISQEEFNPEHYRVSWAIPYETLIRSSAKFGSKECRTFCIYNEKPDSLILKSTKEQFRGAEFAYPILTTALRKIYFDINPLETYSNFKP